MNAFRAAVENRDVDAMRAALHPDVVFRSPAVFTPYEGVDDVMGLLGHVIEVFEDFEYTDELEGRSTHALVFAARVGDKRVEGLDHLTLDPDGLVTELVVMVRPLSGLIALAQAMGARLESSA
ncbi:MAG TPA: nuclear transport factor 2 family protein [Thermoleophilaceae bacterium]|nr:nuclear transport factor 2 family protein [Thermoleophilaceae bacterium]